MPNGGWVNTEEVEILQWYFGNQPKTPPPTLYVALCTAEPNDDGTFVEMAWGGATPYARQPIAANEWDILGAAEGDPSFIANANAITFGTSNTAAGTATHFALCTAASGATMVFSGKIVQPPNGLVIDIGTQPQFDAGALRPQLGSDTP